MSHNVKIVTDSNCDLTPELMRAWDIAGMGSSHVVFGDKSWRTTELSPADFYAEMRSNPNFPKTSQPSVGDFLDIYERLKSEEILAVHISKHLSGTMQTSITAAGMIDRLNLTLFDTENVSVGEALLVREAAEMAHAGERAAAIKTRLESLLPRSRFYVMFDTLENLKRGGRMSGAQALLGGLLQMKPIVTIKNGKLEPFERIRTSAKAIARLKEVVATDLAGASNSATRPIILHAHVPEVANTLAADLATLLGIKQADILILEAGPAIATHSGPGAVGVAYLV